MTNNPLIPQSKLPQLGTTIFTQMSALAQQHQAINLSQGFPDFDGPRYLQERLAYHVDQGANQYAPMTGVQALREAIAQKTERLYGYQPDADSDITVTAGCGSHYRQRHSGFSNGVVYGALYQRENESVFLYRGNVADVGELHC